MSFATKVRILKGLEEQYDPDGSPQADIQLAGGGKTYSGAVQSVEVEEDHVLLSSDDGASIHLSITAIVAIVAK